MPRMTTTLTPEAVGILRVAVGNARSSIALVVDELRRATPDRWTGILVRARSLSGLAEESIAIAEDALLTFAGPAPTVPDLTRLAAPQLVERSSPGVAREEWAALGLAALARAGLEPEVMRSVRRQLDQQFAIDDGEIAGAAQTG